MKPDSADSSEDFNCPLPEESSLRRELLPAETLSLAYGSLTRRAEERAEASTEDAAASVIR